MIKSVKAIIKFKGKYLLQLRDNKRNIFFPNFWGLFGGQINKNETTVSAILREVKEETNLKIKKPKKIVSVKYNLNGVKNKRDLTYFDCKIGSCEKISLEEGQMFKFFSFDQLKKLKIIPMDYFAIHSHFYKNRNYNSYYR